MVQRTRRQHVERERDEELLAWLARFRFVSAREAQARFGVSERMCRARLARLQQAELVISCQPHLATHKLYAISRPGGELLGHPRRREPRWEVQADHELAIAGLSARVESARPDLRVLTERECRRAEADGPLRYSVDCLYEGRSQRRWPDLVIEGNGSRAAVEIELAPKTTRRLEAILLGYLLARAYARVHLRCGSPAVERRVAQLAARLDDAGMLEVSAH